MGPTDQTLEGQTACLGSPSRGGPGPQQHVRDHWKFPGSEKHKRERKNKDCHIHLVFLFLQ